jgi:hypothetical protein
MLPPRIPLLEGLSLGTLETLRKATISFVMEETGFHWVDFHEIRYLRIFRKSVKKIQASLKYDKNTGFFT